MRVALFSGWLIIVAVFLYFGFSTPDEPQWWWDSVYPVKRYSTLLYWKLHPMKIWDYLGIGMFIVGTFSFLGAWGIFTGEMYFKNGEAKWIVLGGFVLAAAGAGFCYM